MTNQTQIIAVCGKGGVGKTCLSALITLVLAEDPSRKVLAIDADPAVGLALPLGMQTRRTIDDIRCGLIQALGDRHPTDKAALLRQVDYEILEAMTEKNNLGFLAIGRPEGDGCYCRVNSLLREIIQDVATRFDYVIIDGEAGIEQINRRVMEMVTHLLLVTDASLKGRTVANIIARVAKTKIGFQQAGLFFNRMESRQEAELLSGQESLKVVGWMAENPVIKQFDRKGERFTELPDSTFTELKQTIERFLHD